MINNQPQSQNMNVQILQIMLQDAQKVSGFSKETRKNLKQIASALGLKDSNQRKNDLVNDILNKVSDLLFKANFQKPEIATSLKLDHPVVNSFPNLRELIVTCNKIYQNNSQQMNIQRFQQMHNQQQFMYQPQFNQMPYEMMQPQNMFIPQQQNSHYQQQQYPQNKSGTNCFCIANPWLRLNPSENPENILLCTNTSCQKKFHISCLKLHSPEQKAMFECPYCVLMKMDPSNQVMYTLVNPDYLKHGIPTQKQFFITEEQHGLLFKTSVIHAVEIRCIRLDSKIMYETTWPDYGEMDINQHKIMEFKPLQSNSSLKKRKDEKYFLKTPQILQIGQNTMSVKEYPSNSEQKQNFRIQENAVHMFAVFIVKKVTNSQLVKQILQKNLRSVETSKNYIKEQLREKDNIEDAEADGDVRIDKLRITLNCNFDFKMIITPAKGKWCKHVQCFSLENMILITESQIPRKWKCPICKLKCHDMIVDEYVLNIIEEVKKQNIKVLEVTFDQEGQYHLQINNKKEESDMEDEQANNYIQQKMEIEVGNQMGLIQQPQMQKKQENNTKNKEALIILSDEEDINNHTTNANQGAKNFLNNEQNAQQLATLLQNNYNQQKNQNNQQRVVQVQNKFPQQQQSQNQQQQSQTFTQQAFIYDNKNIQKPNQIEQFQPESEKIVLKNKIQTPAVEPNYYKTMKNKMVEESKEQIFIYKDKSFDDFLKNPFYDQNDMKVYENEKIEQIGNHKVIKAVKKQYQEIFNIIKKDLQVTSSGFQQQETEKYNKIFAQISQDDKTQTGMKDFNLQNQKRIQEFMEHNNNNLIQPQIQQSAKQPKKKKNEENNLMTQFIPMPGYNSMQKNPFIFEEQQIAFLNMYPQQQFQQQMMQNIQGIENIVQSQQQQQEQKAQNAKGKKDEPIIIDLEDD